MKLVKCLPVVGLSLFLFCGYAFGITYEDALKRAKDGDYNAQSYMGYLYLCGKGVKKNDGAARYWYEVAASNPAADAKLVAYSNFVLGMLYQTGKGGVKCYRTAMDCFRKAAQQGYTDAHINIGLLYAKGLGVRKDYNKALYWWKQAAEDGHPSAAGYVARLEKKLCTIDQ